MAETRRATLEKMQQAHYPTEQELAEAARGKSRPANDNRNPDSSGGNEGGGSSGGSGGYGEDEDYVGPRPKKPDVPKYKPTQPKTPQLTTTLKVKEQTKQQFETQGANTGDPSTLPNYNKQPSYESDPQDATSANEQARRQNDNIKEDLKGIDSVYLIEGIIGLVAAPFILGERVAYLVGQKALKWAKDKLIEKYEKYFGNDFETHPSTPVGHKSKEIRIQSGTNSRATISGREYSGHALDRMQERGLTPSMIEGAIKNGLQSKGNLPHRILHYDSVNKVTIVTESGNVITVIFGGRKL
jgi:hypothetical protein